MVNLELIKEHPYATGVIVLVGAAGLYFVMRSKGGTTVVSGGSDPNSLAAQLQMAQINSASENAMSQYQAQIQIANLQAGVANNQTDAALEAYKVQGDTAIKLAQIQAESDTALKLKSIDAQSLIYKTLFDNASKEQISANELAKFSIDKKYNLAQQSIQLSKQGGRGDIGLNMFAIAMGQGDVSSYNSASASKSIASDMMWANIMSGISKMAVGLV